MTFLQTGQKSWESLLQKKYFTVFLSENAISQEVRCEFPRKTGPKSPCHILMVILVWQPKIGVPGIEMSHFIKIHKETHYILSDFLDLLKNIEKQRRYPQLSDHHGFRLQIGDIYLF